MAKDIIVLNTTTKDKKKIKKRKGKSKELNFNDYVRISSLDYQKIYQNMGFG